MIAKQSSMFKVILAAICVSLAALTGVYMAQADPDRWDSHADTSWYNEMYITFTIDTKEKLAGVAKLVNDGQTADGKEINGFQGRILEIDRNLDLSEYQWVPIGNADRPFKGTLLGENAQVFTLSGMRVISDTSYWGLIGYMDGGTVGGLEFAADGRLQVDAPGRDIYIGAVVGKMTGNSIVHQVTNHLAINADAGAYNMYAGGLVGSAEGTISLSVNDAAVEATGVNSSSGGLVGYSSANGLKVKKSSNSGLVTATSSGAGDSIAGGIVGQSTAVLTMIEESTPIGNSGAVTAVQGVNSYAGGIIGLAGGETDFSEQTSNSGAVTVTAADASSSYAGGLAGAITAPQQQELFQVQFASSGAVSTNGASRAHTGGLFGKVEGNMTWNRNFTNTVPITVTGASELYTGGLIGRMTGNLTFTGKAGNSALVSVSGGANEVYTGGLIGFGASRVLLDNSDPQAYVNSGELQVTAGSGVATGGIISNLAYSSTAGTAPTNVHSTGNITVNGQTKLYTGGYIGLVDSAVAADTAINGAVYTNEIKVEAAQSDSNSRVSTGGVVGEYIGGDGVKNTAFKGKLDVVGQAGSYTGGIIGYMQGSTISHTVIGNTTDQYASITADAVLGGVAGYADGTIEETQVSYIALAGRPSQVVAGGVAGLAQGTITNAVVGDVNHDASHSVTIAADLAAVPAGSDEFAAGGVIGRNSDNLTLSGIEVARIQLVTEPGRSGYTFGAVAGELTEKATAGSKEQPLNIHDIAFTVQAANSYIGGAAGRNNSAKLHAVAERLELQTAGEQVRIGGIAAVNTATLLPDNTLLSVQDSELGSTGASSILGGLFAEQHGEVVGTTMQQDVEEQEQIVLADRVRLVSTAADNKLGGVAGWNTGVLADTRTSNIVIHASGARVEAGGIAGRMETVDGGVLASITRANALAGEETLLTAAGADGHVGGLVGYIKNARLADSRAAAIIPDYVALSVQGTGVSAGALAGTAEDSVMIGNAVKINAENVLLTTSAAATNARAGGLVGTSLRTQLEKLVGYKVNLVLNGTDAEAGGIVGYNLGSNNKVITGTYVTELNLRANAAAQRLVAGGFIGRNAQRAGDTVPDPAAGVSTIQSSRVAGSIQSSAPLTVAGGMAGENNSLIANNSITDKNPLTLKGNQSIAGGLVGVNKGTGVLYYTYTNANLAIEGTGTLTGGLVGHNEQNGRIIASYIDNDVTSKANGTASEPVFTGGLVGRNSGIINKSYAVAKVTSEGAYTLTGGLVGEQLSGSIDNSYSGKSVHALQQNSYAGGLIGRIVAGQISYAYSASQVVASSEAYAGGFAGRYDNASRELLFKSYYIKDEDKLINKDLSDFADGNHRFLNAHGRLSTILAGQLENRDVFPGLSGWDFTNTWKYGSLSAQYKYPELIRTANSGGGSSEEVNTNLRWYLLDKDAVTFEIGTEAELAGLAAIVNGTVPGEDAFSFEGRTIRITKPIHIQSLQWVPIGDTIAHGFQGTLDGGNHLIDGLTVQPEHIYGGLFGVIGDKAEVKNVTLEPLHVAGQQATGSLVGLNKGTINKIDIRLLNGATVSGKHAGGAVGENEGTLEAVIKVTIDGGSEVKSQVPGAIAGGVVGVNRQSLQGSVLEVHAVEGTVSAQASGGYAGGVIGEQTGDLTGFELKLEPSYKVQADGEGSAAGGIVGHYASGKAQDIKLELLGQVKAAGDGSAAGGAFGYSEPNNVIADLIVVTTAGSETPQVVGDYYVGGALGFKEGSGTAALDAERVKVQELFIQGQSTTRTPIIGGVAGGLSQAAAEELVSNAVIQASGPSPSVGGIVGWSDSSIVSKATVVPHIKVSALSGEAAAGGVIGRSESADLNKRFDFGRLIPFYYGIYQADVQQGSIELAMDAATGNSHTGGLIGYNQQTSVYYSQTAASLKATGGTELAAGGAVGTNLGGILVHVKSSGVVDAAGGTVLSVGGVVGRTDGGEIHYSEAKAAGGAKVTAGQAVTRPGRMPVAQIGGFVGKGDNTKMTHSYADIPVQVEDSNQDNTMYTGGFAGLLGDASTQQALISDAYAKGNVTVKGITGAYTGGFAGSVDQYMIKQAYASGNVHNTGFDTRSGGFAGAVERYASIDNAYALSDKVETIGINHATNAYAGGFAGYNDGKLKQVYAGVPTITINVSGANVYRGALIGYQFRQGAITESTYSGTLNPIGYNLGQSSSVAAVPASDMGAVRGWSYEVDTLFLTGKQENGLVIGSAPQLAGAVLLYNADTGLTYYKLFDRTAADKPEFALLTLSADIDWSGRAWTPFDRFTGVWDGAGHTISGLSITGEVDAEQAAGFIAIHEGTLKNIRFDQPKVVVTGQGHTGVAAGTTGAEALISGVVIEQADIKGNGPTGAVVGSNSGTISQTKVTGLKLESTGVAGGLAGRNLGKLESSQVEGKLSSSGEYTGGAVGVNEGEIAGLEATVAIDVTSATQPQYVGGIAGLNQGELGNSQVNGTISSGAAYTGGTAGVNEGTIDQVTISGVIRSAAAAPQQLVRAGGVTADNRAAGSISHSFSYADVLVTAAEAQAGGLSGSNEGAISYSYNSGRVEAQGTAKAWAGGIAGYAAAGEMNNTVSTGEIIASVNGKVVSGQTFYGGLAGQKADAAVIGNSVYNKQQLKNDTAYYSSVAKQVAGTNAAAQGLTAKALTAGQLPVQLDATKWTATAGFYPQLTAYAGSTRSKLSAAAVVLDVKDSINKIRSAFGLTADDQLVWSADPAKAEIEQAGEAVQGTLKGTGSITFKVAAGNQQRELVLNTPVVPYSETAKTPYVVSGDNNFLEKTSIVLAVDEPGAKLYYTLDGTEPSEESSLYSSPIELRKTTELKVVAMVSEKEPSQILSQTWTRHQPVYGSGGFGPIMPEKPKDEPVVVGARSGQKTVSSTSEEPVTIARNSKLVLTAPAGQIIYYTTDGSTPTTSSKQYTGEIIITGKMTIKAITSKDNRVVTMNYEVDNADYALKKNAAEIKYISGYSNNTFKPNASMTRYELVTALAPLIDKEDVTVANLFSDVKANQADQIAFFTSAGIVQGYPDGTFGGDKPLTRAEFVVTLSRVLHLNPGAAAKEASAPLFSDLEGHWAASYVKAFVEAGYVKGFPDGTFRPDSKLSRAEAVVLINRITGAAKQSQPEKFTDVLPSHWAYEDIMAVVKP